MSDPNETLRATTRRLLDSGAEPITEVTAETPYWVKFGLAGYGPDLEPDDEPTRLEDLDGLLEDELTRAADQAEEVAHAHAAGGDYESAWKEHERAEALAVHAANFNPKRKEAPAYAGRPELWLATVYHQLSLFPLDVSSNERLYVWKAEDA